MHTIADINKSHQQFWKEQSALLASRILDRDLYDRASEDMQSEIRTGVRLYSRKTMEQALEDANRARRLSGQSPAGSSARQRDYARRSRGKVTPEGTTIVQLIELQLLRHKDRDLIAKEFWPVFCMALKNRGLDPIEIERPRSGTFGCTYRFKQGRKQLTFKTFSNHVARFRSRKSR